jgi:hypothetical protein
MLAGNADTKTEYTREVGFSFVIGCFIASAEGCITIIRFVSTVNHSRMYLRHVFQAMDFSTLQRSRFSPVTPYSTCFPNYKCATKKT